MVRFCNINAKFVGTTADVFRVSWKSEKYGEIEAATKKIYVFKGKDIASKIGGELGYPWDLNNANIIQYYCHVVTPTYVVIVTQGRGLSIST